MARLQGLLAAAQGEAALERSTAASLAEELHSAQRRTAAFEGLLAEASAAADEITDLKQARH